MTEFFKFIRKYPRKFTLLFGLIIILAISNGVSTYLEKKDAWSQSTNLSIEEVLTAIENADTLVFKGDIDDIYQEPFIEADGIYVASVSDNWIFSDKVSIVSNDYEVIYLDNYDSSDKTTNSYAFYNCNNEISGYCIESEISDFSGHDKPVYLFYNSENISKDYYLDTNDGFIFCDFSGNCCLTANYTSDSTTGLYEVIISTLSPNDVQTEEKLLLYQCVVDSMFNNYSGH